MPENFREIHVLFLMGYGMFLLVNCTPNTKTVTLPVDTTSEFTRSGSEMIPSQWWESFHDNELNLLVDSALGSNLNLRSAWYRIRAAKAVVKRESSSLFPSLDGSMQAEVGQFQSEFDQFQGTQRLRIGLSSNYEVDLWGRIRSRVDAEKFRAEATYEDYQATAIFLSAEIVRTWYRLIEANNQVDLINGQIETNEQVLSLLRARFGRGQVRSVDILRQEQLIESTRRQLVFAEARVDVLEHQLSVLLGNNPISDLEYQDTNLPEVPPLPRTGVPGDLVQRRPDVRSAYNNLLAADRDLASAISNKFPRLNLSASISTAASDFGNFISNWGYSVAGDLIAPIIYAGELRAEVDRNRAIKYQALYDYGQVVLISLQEVEDALIQETKQDESIESLESQLNLAQQTIEQLRIEYFNGMSDYLDVLTALSQEQQLQRDLLSANLSLIEFRISLYTSLAGGFEQSENTLN